MGKIEKKIEVINKYINNCTTWNCSTYGNIPKEKFYNACRSYAGNLDYNQAIGMIDTTVFGSGKKGMIFMQDAVYFSTNQGGKYFEYSKPVEFSGRVEYSCEILNDMITRLKNIEIYDSEEAPNGWEMLGSFIGGAMNFISELSEESKDQNQTNNNDNRQEEVLPQNLICDAYNEKENKDESEDLLETINEVKEVLTYLNKDLIDEFVNAPIDNEDKFNEIVVGVVLSSAMLTKDPDLVGFFDEDIKQNIDEVNEILEPQLKLVENTLNSDLVNEINMEKISIMKVVNLYNHRVKVVLEDLEDEEDNEDIYDSIQIALKDFRKSLKQMIKLCNMFIEKIYIEA